MAFFNNPEESKAKQHEGFLKSLQVDVIKWEPTGEQTKELVHKFEYEDFPDESQLIVAPSQMAVFINNLNSGDSIDEEKDGTAQICTFTGPCRITLETKDSRFAPFRNLVNSLTGGVSAFHSQVYFIDTTYMTDLSWGTVSPIVVTDPVEEVNVHVRAFGVFGVHIEQQEGEKSVEQVNRFLRRVVGTGASFTKEDLLSFMRAKILEYVPNLLAKKMVEEGVGILQISTKMTEFSNTIGAQLVPYFEEIGLTLDNFSFHSINAPDADLKAINDMKIERKRARMEAEGNAIRMDIESEARVRQREREGYSYQEERTFDVMENAASNEGSAGAVMGTGIGLGMATGVGSVISNNFNNIAANTGSKKDASDGDGMFDYKICESCGQKLPKVAKFCYICGEKTGSSVCPECGAELAPKARFCMECGKRL